MKVIAINKKDDKIFNLSSMTDKQKYEFAMAHEDIAIWDDFQSFNTDLKDKLVNVKENNIYHID